MEKQQLKLSLSRAAWGQILFIAAVFSIAGALLLDALGLVSTTLGPIPFVSAIVLIKLSLFAFWPVISKKGTEASTVLHGVFNSTYQQVEDGVRGVFQGFAPRRRRHLSLWDQNDPRLDAALFSANVPTFIVNHEQIILDWNPAFAMIFAGCRGVRRGAHISVWFEHLDNFKNVSKRQEKLYGEGILPITDRERATFLSPRYGRMVFTKIMTPIIDRDSGRIVGWTVVLNVNSVNKRQEFFERLYAEIAAETRRMRHAAAYDNVVGRTSLWRSLAGMHLEAMGVASRVLELGCGTGRMTAKLAESGKKITAVDDETHLLRKAKDKTESFGSQVRIVRQSLDDLRKLPTERYDAASLMLLGHKLDDLSETIKIVKQALKPGAVISISGILPGHTIEDLFNDVRTWHESHDGFDTLKFQFQHVIEHEQQLALRGAFNPRSREDLRAALIENGFEIEGERSSAWNGKVLFLKARKL